MRTFTHPFTHRAPFAALDRHLVGRGLRALAYHALELVDLCTASDGAGGDGNGGGEGIHSGGTKDRGRCSAYTCRQQRRLAKVEAAIRHSNPTQKQQQLTCRMPSDSLVSACEMGGAELKTVL